MGVHNVYTAETILTKADALRHIYSPVVPDELLVLLVLAREYPALVKMAKWARLKRENAPLSH